MGLILLYQGFKLSVLIRVWVAKCFKPTPTPPSYNPNVYIVLLLSFLLAFARMAVMTVLFLMIVNNNEFFTFEKFTFMGAGYFP